MISYVLTGVVTFSNHFFHNLLLLSLLGANFYVGEGVIAGGNTIVADENGR